MWAAASGQLQCLASGNLPDVCREEIWGKFLELFGEDDEPFQQSPNGVGLPSLGQEQRLATVGQAVSAIGWLINTSGTRTAVTVVGVICVWWFGPMPRKALLI